MSYNDNQNNQDKNRPQQPGQKQNQNPNRPINPSDKDLSKNRDKYHEGQK